RHDERARLDAVGDDPVGRARELGDALDLEARRPRAVDPRAHPVEQRREVAHLGLARRVLDHGRALGERGRHHEVLGPRDRHQIGCDPGALEAARARDHVAVLDRHLGAEPGEALQVLVDRPDADRAPAGQRHVLGRAHPDRAAQGDTSLDLEPRRHQRLPATNRSTPARSARVATSRYPAARKRSATLAAWAPPAVSRTSIPAGPKAPWAVVTILLMSASPSGPPSSAARGSCRETSGSRPGTRALGRYGGLLVTRAA